MEPRLRASPEQFLALIEFMERHGDISRPQGGPQGRLRGDRLWQELTSMMNSIGSGVNKSQDKWKKVWADWKTKTKKKYMLIRRHASGTGGGPSSRLTLTALEERVVAVIGVSAVVGQASIRELGFNTTASEPLQQEFHEVLPSTSRAPEPVAWTPPSSAPVRPPQSPLSPFLPEPTSQPRRQSQPSPPRRFQPQQTPTRREPAPPSPQRQSQSTPTQHRPPSASPQSQAQRTPRRGSQPRAAVARRLLQLTPSRQGQRPPPTTNRVSASPETPARRRPQLTARRNRGQTPFDRAASEFAAVELRRLRLEESRERWINERELERIAVDRDRNQVAREHVELLRQLGGVLELLLGVLTQNRPSNSLASTDILPD